MRKWLILGLLAGLAASVGCATVNRTAAENRAAHRHIVDFEIRQIGDDWNLIWLADRQSRLTKWHTR